MRYAEAREEIMSYIEGRRDTFGVKPMDIDNHEDTVSVCNATCWGGAENYGNDESQYAYPYP